MGDLKFLCLSEPILTLIITLTLTQDEIQAIKNVLPDAWDEVTLTLTRTLTLNQSLTLTTTLTLKAAAFQVESEAKYVAKRAAKGFN